MDESLINTHVGDRLRHARIVRGGTLEKLSQAIDVSYPQLAKFERGHNRISAAALYRLSRALDLDFGYFFDGLEPDPSAFGPLVDARLLAQIERIADANVRTCLRGLIRALGAKSL